MQLAAGSTSTRAEPFWQLLATLRHVRDAERALDQELTRSRLARRLASPIDESSMLGRLTAAKRRARPRRFAEEVREAKAFLSNNRRRYFELLSLKRRLGVQAARAREPFLRERDRRALRHAHEMAALRARLRPLPALLQRLRDAKRKSALNVPGFVDAMASLVEAALLKEGF